MTLIRKLKKHAVVLDAVACASLLAATPLRADNAGRPWKDAAQLTFLGAGGNTRSTTLGADNDFAWAAGRWAAEQTAGALSTRNDQQRTAEQYHAEEKVQYKVSERNFAFEDYRWERNTFAGIFHRHNASAGLGRDWIKTDRDDLLTELGGGYVNEELVPSGRNQFGSGRAYGKYVRTLSATASFSQDAEYLRNFKEDRDYRVNTRTALTASVTAHLSLKLEYDLKFRNRPPAGFGKSDTLTSAAVIVNY